MGRGKRRRKSQWPANDRDEITRADTINIRIRGGPLLRAELDRARRDGDGPPSTRREKRTYRGKVRFIDVYCWGDVRRWAEGRGYVLVHEPIAFRELERAQRKPVGASNALNDKEAGRYIGKSQSWMMKARMARRGPRYVKDGRSVRYRIADLDAYLAAHLVETAAA